MEKLKDIVSKVFDTDINIKTRKRNNVEARMIFSKILREDGNTFESIGNAINKDHSTIVYYVNQASVLIKQSIELSDKYLECKNCYIDNLDVVLPQMKYDELKNIINLVAERTHVGKEEFIERKINQMFNGI